MEVKKNKKHKKKKKTKNLVVLGLLFHLCVHSRDQAEVTRRAQQASFSAEPCHQP